VPESSSEYRDAMLSAAKEEGGADALWERLCAIDPESALKTHKNNIRRVIRALEIYDKTGKTKSYFDRLSKAENPDMRIGMITLDFHNRDVLYAGVDSRVDAMVNAGLVDEVRGLFSTGKLPPDSTAAQAIGYKEIILHLLGEISLPEAVDMIKLSSRRYAKRQLTWFRHEEGAYRLYIDDESGRIRDFDNIISEAHSAALEFLKGFNK
jgi:tRNA dimethylallyltransferase